MGISKPIVIHCLDFKMILWDFLSVHFEQLLSLCSTAAHYILYGDVLSVYRVHW